MPAISSYTNYRGTHWRKHAGMTACGAKVQTDRGDTIRRPVDCPTCQQILASWYRDARWVLRSDAPLKTFELPGANDFTFRQAETLLKELRRQQFRWKKALGYFPKLWVELNTDTLPRGARTQGDTGGYEEPAHAGG